MYVYIINVSKEWMEEMIAESYISEAKFTSIDNRKAFGDLHFDEIHIDAFCLDEVDFSDEVTAFLFTDVISLAYRNSDLMNFWTALLSDNCSDPTEFRFIYHNTVPYFYE